MKGINNMADWFKFYEDELDREEFQAAWNECKALPSILVWCRCQATKAKSDRFTINNKYQMIGLAQKLKITEHELKQGLELLQEIGYIRLEDNQVIFQDWERHQSKYLYEKQRKQKRLEPPKCQDVPTNYPQPEHTEPTNYPESTLRGEETRGEEIRKEGTKKEQFELLQMQRYFDPPLIKNFHQVKAIFARYDIKLTSPVSSCQALQRMLAVDSFDFICGLVEKALKSKKFPKIETQWGLINFQERYKQIKETFKQPVSASPEPVYGVPIPQEVKQRMQILINKSGAVKPCERSELS